MTEFSHTPPEDAAPIEVGKPLPGLEMNARKRPEGVAYWDQVIPSPFGDLFYAPEQERGGTLRWTTEYGGVHIDVDLNGTVTEINENVDPSTRSPLEQAIFGMGMRAWQAAINAAREKDQ